jgi:hypothetical protein
VGFRYGPIASIDRDRIRSADFCDGSWRAAHVATRSSAGNQSSAETHCENASSSMTFSDVRRAALLRSADAGCQHCSSAT